MGEKVKISVVFLMISTTMILCGWLFEKKEFVLDMEQKILYQNSSVDQIIADIEKSSEAARKNYDNGYYAVSGKISDISKNKKVWLCGSTEDSDTAKIECKISDKALSEKIEELKIREKIRVYGKVEMSSHNNVTMKVVQIERAEAEAMSGTMSYADGKTYDISNMVARNLAGGKVEYYIPSNWEEVEKDIIKEKLGNIEGYQYALNGISGEEVAEPESIFVCYFDSKAKLKDRSQKSRKKEIRKTIIDNVLKTDGKGVKTGKIKNKESYDGKKFYYYDGGYQDWKGQGHHVEFVFQEDANDGMIVYLYMYKEENPEHIDDILCVMRCLKIE